LNAGGTYDGIEIALDKFRYCQQTFSSRHANFRFHHANIHSSFYNPLGQISAAKYRFPFDDESFDFVFLVSVFTHMLPADVEHYLAEIARVLVKRAKCICTFWLTAAPMGSPYHKHSEFCELYSRQHPEHGVIYLEEYLRSLYQRQGLNIQHVYHGNWMKRQQHIVVAVR
jgi:SAM-dependent methyltransferase